LFSCKTDTEQINSATKDAEKSTQSNSDSPQLLKQFNTLREMVEYSYEFYEVDGTLKFISEEDSNLHIQISSPIFELDQEIIKEQIVKRDIIYFAFQSFAKTNIDKLTITSIPISAENDHQYCEEYKKTITIDRTNAKLILKKFLNSEDFSILYDKNTNAWIKNANFNKLLYENIHEVFAEMSKK